MYNNFCLRVYLSSPILLQDNTQLSLDSVLAMALYQQSNDLVKSHTEIPLARVGPVWQGSSAFLYSPFSQAPIPYQKTFIAAVNPIRLGDTNRAIIKQKFYRDRFPNQTQMDAYKGYAVQQVIWFGYGDAQVCLKLVESLSHIGKKRAHGFGRIDKVVMEPLQTNRAWVLPNGSPSRVIPVGLWEKLQNVQPATQLPQDFSALEPPYWNTTSCELSVLPSVRFLSEAHMEHIDGGWQENLPSDYAASPQKSINGIDFFYQHIGQALFQSCGIEGTPTDEDCSICGASGDNHRFGNGYTYYCPKCITFGGRYENIKVPGRMGGGWAGIVTPNNATTLYTSVEYDTKNRPFTNYKNVDLRCGKEALSRLLPDITNNPPEPPYLWFHSGNSVTKVVKNLQVSWSNRRVYRSGDTPLSVDLIKIREALTRFHDSGLPKKPTKDALRAYSKQRIEGGERDSRLENLYKKYPQLQDLVPQLPDAFTNDYFLFSQQMQEIK